MRGQDGEGVRRAMRLKIAVLLGREGRKVLTINHLVSSCVRFQDSHASLSSIGEHNLERNRACLKSFSMLSDIKTKEEENTE